LKTFSSDVVGWHFVRIAYSRFSRQIVFNFSIKIFHRARRLEINPPAWVAAITTGVRALHFTNLQLLQKFDKLDDRWHVFNLTGPTSALDSLVAAVVSVEHGILTEDIFYLHKRR
jgi:hypothetical protein